MSRDTRQRLAGVGVVMALMIIAFVAGGWLAQTRNQMARSRHEFDELVNELRAGTIVIGTPNVVLAGKGKPVGVVSRDYNLMDGTGFSLLVYYHEFDVLQVHTHDGKLFAAQLVEGGVVNEEEWFFCDVELLERYIGLAEAGSAGAEG
jgi:hypothetical protein